ncbi:tubulin-tyrosine ligase family-domain-containing protein [Dunaliella salina]|uniref:Tubulin-tyrosine ligase family-domain-containing protein n=1 Tax=Dunaliella salina TaxID=3046 RepID=A0ABQ7GQH1_DUNSA|nr:tubulin-tyrosine ligase family-domain-containing protein [Dunaliella salina]|eukprot:KAF5836848.1 tubulin-tyrosine ligase family-domain-containing protein [Dunaliella salina]
MDFDNAEEEPGEEEEEILGEEDEHLQQQQRQEQEQQEQQQQEQQQQGHQQSNAQEAHSEALPASNTKPPLPQKEAVEEQQAVLAAAAGIKKKKKPPPPIRINLANCKYDVLRNVQRKLGWKEVGDDEEWEVYWTDMSVGIERIMKLNKTQKINHFNGMLELCRKKNMARNLSKMCKLFPEHYDFMPRTFSLPIDMQELMSDVRARGKKQIYILKPDAGCQGKGIKLVQGGKEENMAKAIREMELPNAVAQHYMAKPLLVNGFKFDVRLYALVLSCDPLRVFIYKEGLTRICTEKYTKPKAENLGLTYMHLTNYAVNKHNESFMAGNQAQAEAEAAASKWTLEQLAHYLRGQGYDWGLIWERMQHLVVKSLISVQPIVRNNYRSILPPDNDGFSCFEILGYDVMLDDELRPWLLEVNHSPSFCIDSPLDQAIKEQLILDTLELARIDPKLISKAKKAERKATAGRLLEPLHKRKPTSASSSNAPSAHGSTTPTSASAGTTANSATAGAVSAQQSQPGEEGLQKEAAAAYTVPSKPKTAEEYEALRQEVLAKREKYEAKHMGGYTRIYPSANKELQELYEKLLKGAAELFQSSFQAKAKKALDVLGEERKKKEEPESDAVKAEKARARAHRDRLAQMALERRAKKAEVKAEADAVAALQTAQAANEYSAYLTQSGLAPPQVASQVVMTLGNGFIPAHHAGTQGYYQPGTSPFAPLLVQQGPAGVVPAMPGASMNGALGAYPSAAGAYAGGGGGSGAGLSLLNRVGSYGGVGGVGGNAGMQEQQDGLHALAGSQSRSEVSGESEVASPCSGSAANSRPGSSRSSCPNSGHTTNIAGEHLSFLRSSSPGLLQAQSAAHHLQHHLAQQQPPSHPGGLASQAHYQHHHPHHHSHHQHHQHHRDHSSFADAWGGGNVVHSQPVRGPSRKEHVESSFSSELNVPPVSFGSTHSESSRALPRPAHVDFPPRSSSPSSSSHGALHSLSLQPGSLSSPGGYQVKRPSASQHQYQQAYASPQGGLSGGRAGGDRPNVPAISASPLQSSGLKPGVHGWGGGPERTLSSSFLSPRSQLGVRPDSSIAHTRPSSGAHHSSHASDWGHPSLIEKLHQPGIDSPTHPIYSSANPALVVAAPYTLGGVFGSPASISPVHPSSAHRSRRALSASLRDSSKRTEWQQQQQQQQQQQLLEQRLQALHQQQQQQQQQHGSPHPLHLNSRPESASSSGPTAVAGAAGPPNPAPQRRSTSTPTVFSGNTPDDHRCVTSPDASRPGDTFPVAMLLPPATSNTTSPPHPHSHPHAQQQQQQQQHVLHVHTFPPVRPPSPPHPPPPPTSLSAFLADLSALPSQQHGTAAQVAGTSSAAPNQAQHRQTHAHQQGGGSSSGGGASGGGPLPHAAARPRYPSNSEAGWEGKQGSVARAPSPTGSSNSQSSTGGYAASSATPNPIGPATAFSSSHLHTLYGPGGVPKAVMHGRGPPVVGSSSRPSQQQQQHTPAASPSLAAPAPVQGAGQGGVAYRQAHRYHDSEGMSQGGAAAGTAMYGVLKPGALDTGQARSIHPAGGGGNVNNRGGGVGVKGGRLGGAKNLLGDSLSVTGYKVARGGS